MDWDEIEAIFGALASFDDIRVTKMLGELLGERNLSRDKGVVRKQILAAQALGSLGTDGAARTLKQHAGRWHLSGPVKDAVAQAINQVGRP